MDERVRQESILSLFFPLDRLMVEAAQKECLPFNIRILDFVFRLIAFVIFSLSKKESRNNSQNRLVSANSGKSITERMELFFKKYKGASKFAALLQELFQEKKQLLASLEKSFVAFHDGERDVKLPEYLLLHERIHELSGARFFNECLFVIRRKDALFTLDRNLQKRFLSFDNAGSLEEGVYLTTKNGTEFLFAEPWFSYSDEEGGASERAFRYLVDRDAAGSIWCSIASRRISLVADDASVYNMAGNFEELDLKLFEGERDAEREVRKKVRNLISFYPPPVNFSTLLELVHSAENNIITLLGPNAGAAVAHLYEALRRDESGKVFYYSPDPSCACSPLALAGALSTWLCAVSGDSASCQVPGDNIEKTLEHLMKLAVSRHGRLYMLIDLLAGSSETGGGEHPAFRFLPDLLDKDVIFILATGAPHSYSPAGGREIRFRIEIPSQAEIASYFLDNEMDGGFSRVPVEDYEHLGLLFWLLKKKVIPPDPARAPLTFAEACEDVLINFFECNLEDPAILLPAIASLSLASWHIQPKKLALLAGVDEYELAHLLLPLEGIVVQENGYFIPHRRFRAFVRWCLTRREAREVAKALLSAGAPDGEPLLEFIVGQYENDFRLLLNGCLPEKLVTDFFREGGLEGIRKRLEIALRALTLGGKKKDVKRCLDIAALAASLRPPAEFSLELIRVLAENGMVHKALRRIKHARTRRRKNLEFETLIRGACAKGSQLEHVLASEVFETPPFMSGEKKRVDVNRDVSLQDSAGNVIEEEAGELNLKRKNLFEKARQAMRTGAGEQALELFLKVFTSCGENGGEREELTEVEELIDEKLIGEMVNLIRVLTAGNAGRRVEIADSFECSFLASIICARLATVDIEPSSPLTLAFIKLGLARALEINKPDFLAIALIELEKAVERLTGNGTGLPSLRECSVSILEFVSPEKRKSISEIALDILSKEPLLTGRVTEGIIAVTGPENAGLKIRLAAARVARDRQAFEMLLQHCSDREKPLMALAFLYGREENFSPGEAARLLETVNFNYSFDFLQAALTELSAISGAPALSFVKLFMEVLSLESRQPSDISLFLAWNIARGNIASLPPESISALVEKSEQLMEDMKNVPEGKIVFLLFKILKGEKDACTELLSFLVEQEENRALLCKREIFTEALLRVFICSEILFSHSERLARILEGLGREKRNNFLFQAAFQTLHSDISKTITLLTMLDTEDVFFRAVSGMTDELTGISPSRKRAFLEKILAIHDNFSLNRLPEELLCRVVLHFEASKPVVWDELEFSVGRIEPPERAIRLVIELLPFLDGAGFEKALVWIFKSLDTVRHVDERVRLEVLLAFVTSTYDAPVSQFFFEEALLHAGQLEGIARSGAILDGLKDASTVLKDMDRRLAALFVDAINFDVKKEEAREYLARMYERESDEFQRLPAKLGSRLVKVAEEMTRLGEEPFDMSLLDRFLEGTEAVFKQRLIKLRSLIPDDRAGPLGFSARYLTMLASVCENRETVEFLLLKTVELAGKIPPELEAVRFRLLENAGKVVETRDDESGFKLCFSLLDEGRKYGLAFFTLLVTALRRTLARYDREGTDVIKRSLDEARSFVERIMISL